MANKPYEIFVSDNFMLSGMCEVPSEEWLRRPGVFFDTRTNMLSSDSRFDTFDWYINYLKTTAIFAGKNPSAYPTYMLDLGYIPVVYLPSCCVGTYAEMFAKLDKIDIPYVKLNPTSFVMKYVDIDAVDAWVSKMDISRLWGIPVEQVRSVDVVRRIFG